MRLRIILLVIFLGTLNFALAAQEGSGLSGLIAKGFAEGNIFTIVSTVLLIGLAINLTPCIYPMIPITLSFFSNQAGGDRKARLGLGLMYLLGISVTYGLAGGIAASIGSVFGVLFTKPWFLYSLAMILFGLALSMFDLYQVGIPPFLSRHLRGRSGAVGAIGMGFFVGVAAVACAGPFILAVFTEVAKLQNVFLGILIFMVMGAGLGLPYVFLAVAAGAKSIPRAGGWMKTIKEVMGFVVIGIGLNYLILGLPKSLTKGNEILIWYAFYFIVAFYFIFAQRSETSRAQMVIKGCAILIAGSLAGVGLEKRSEAQLKESLLAVQSFEVKWIPFTQESFEKAKASGKPILIDAWADWCAKCKEIDKVIFANPAAIKMLQNVVTLKVDWSTGVSESYIDYTQDLLGILGPPTFIFMKPGGQQVDSTSKLSSIKDLSARLIKIGVPLEDI